MFKKTTVTVAKRGLGNCLKKTTVTVAKRLQLFLKVASSGSAIFFKVSDTSFSVLPGFFKTADEPALRVLPEFFKKRQHKVCNFLISGKLRLLAVTRYFYKAKQPPLSTPHPIKLRRRIP